MRNSYKVRHPLPHAILPLATALSCSTSLITPINVSVAQKKLVTEISIIGGAKTQPATPLRGP